ncbi:beta-ketoacyl synthase N-terminal-like domain-containing protein [Streptomyces palmae]|uniref:3-oxoacyl-ACP synthase n=1 Tax=Streptomyces palmae TaxID=1701085 RepID=A0A4Z0HK59_9ACTN|nr:beta-ketoacyl synthase N-terminal-like domain-containing protein [Streptomyces palmae]TGB19348.1 3-oxoacyl-ACP synthase [Streptomyces palmae]
MTGPLITDWSAVSPYGIGRAAFEEGFRSGRTTSVPLENEDWLVGERADTEACLVPGFVIKEVLGKKGTRAMDRVTGLVVTTVGRLLDTTGGPLPSEDPDEDTALVLGTTHGSHKSMVDITRDTLTDEKPYYINTAHIPNAIGNASAGMCAIWYGLKGPNATIAAGRNSGIATLNYGRRLLATGRARTVLCGAAEEYTTDRSWLEWHTRGADETGTVLGEGCAMVQLRAPAADGRGDDDALAEVLGVSSGITGPDGVAAGLETVVGNALRRAGIGREEVWAVSASAPAGEAGRQELKALDALFGDLDPLTLGRPGQIGDTGAATSAFQVVATLTAAQDSARAAGRVAVLTSVDRDGALGCALLRMR